MPAVWAVLIIVMKRVAVLLLAAAMVAVGCSSEQPAPQRPTWTYDLQAMEANDAAATSPPPAVVAEPATVPVFAPQPAAPATAAAPVDEPEAVSAPATAPLAADVTPAEAAVALEAVVTPATAPVAPAATLPVAAPTTAPATAPVDFATLLRRDLGAALQGEAVPAAYPGLSADAQRFAISLTQGLRESLAPLAEPDGLPRAVPPILQMADRVRSLADLQVVRAALCMRVESFGVYDPMEAKLPGKRETSVVLYCEMAGFHSRQGDRGMYETRLSQEVSIVDATGQVLWSDPVYTFVDVCRNRRRDFYVARIIRIPATLPPGEHTLSVAISDLYSREIAYAQVAIVVSE